MRPIYWHAIASVCVSAIAAIAPAAHAQRADSPAARSASVPDTVSTGKGFLMGFAPELYFVRRADGVWSFERQDRSVIAM